MTTKSFFIVDDHTLTNRGERELLEEKYECRGFAYSKDEAVEQLAALAEKGRLPDILVLDLGLGNDNGLDLLRVLKETYTDVKVLVYSMYENPGIVSLVMENHADGFVAKSADERELLSAVEKVIGGETYVQSNLVSPLMTYQTDILGGLTRQEQKIFKMIIERKTNKQIEDELNITMRSVENYLSRIYQKTGCKNHEDLIKTFG